MEDREYGKDRRRNRKKEKERTAVVWLSALALLLGAALLVFGFFPRQGDRILSALGLKNAGAAFTAALRGADDTAETEEISGAAVKNSSGSGEEGPDREKETEAGEIQEILVYRETSAAEPETEMPPKYTENENTRLISSGSEIRLSFAGDILFDDRYAIMASLLERSGGTPDISRAFDSELLSLMKGADVFLVNNEFPYSLRGAPLAEKKFTFRADPVYASLLSDMGADLVGLANNHMYDYGEEALLDTLNTLEQLQIPAIGAGRNLEEASAPFYFTNGKIKIGFVCATQIERLGNPDTKGATETSAGVFRCLNPENLVKVIGEMKKECDFIVAYLHWGTESTEVIDEHQKKLAAQAAAAGADLIIGNHPHVLQEIGIVEGVPVVYSLGNFLFNSGAQDTCLITAVLDPDTAELQSLQFVPARQEGCRTKLLAGEEKLRVISYMRSLSEVSIDDDGFVDLADVLCRGRE